MVLGSQQLANTDELASATEILVLGVAHFPRLWAARLRAAARAVDALVGP